MTEDIESGNISHWDKYQDDLDETCDLDKDFKVYPRKIIFSIILTFVMLTVSIIFAYSHVTIREDDGARILAYAGYGLASWFLSSFFCGYYVAFQIKKIWLSFIILSIITTISSFIGTTLAPILFNASYQMDSLLVSGQFGIPRGELSMILVIAVMNIVITLFIVTVGALIGHSTCQQD